jgi:hypothetical protein
VQGVSCCGLVGGDDGGRRSDYIDRFIATSSKSPRPHVQPVDTDGLVLQGGTLSSNLTVVIHEYEYPSKRTCIGFADWPNNGKSVPVEVSFPRRIR